MSATSNIRTKTDSTDTIKAILKLTFEFHSIVNKMAKKEASDEQKRRYYELYYMFKDMQEDLN